MAKQPSGIASKDNLRDWADYAKSHSVEYDPIKSQSKEDLAPCGTYERENDYVRLKNSLIGRCHRRTMRARAGSIGPRLASATATPARVAASAISGNGRAGRRPWDAASQLKTPRFFSP